jgi:protoporphyrinogen oxidase
MAGSNDLVIIGAGPAGLAAGLRAARRGMKVTVLERAGHVGGLAASVEVDGMRVDLGSQRLDATMPAELRAELSALLGDDLQRRRRTSRIRVGQEWLSLPLRADEVTRKLPKQFLMKIARDSALAPFRSAREDNYAAVLRAHVGNTLYDSVYGPLAEKMWGVPGERISLDQFRHPSGRLGNFRLAGRAVRRIGSAARKGSADSRSTTPGIGAYYYPRKGFGQLVEVLADAATAAGADIRCEAEVDSIQVREDEVEVSTQDGDVITGGLVFSTLPLPVLARITRPAPSLTSIEHSARLRYRSMLLVYVVHEGGRWTPFDSHDLPDARTPVARISEPANYRDNPDDPVGRTVLCAEIPCSMTDEVWGLDDDSLGDVVDDALGRTGLPGVSRVHVESRRLGQVYPIYRVGYEADLIEVDKWARMIRGVVTLGRQGLFVLDNIHHALLMANNAVDAIRGDGTFNRYEWAQSRERFRDHRP